MRSAIVLAALSLLVAAVGSEQLTLNTTYPSPLGVYTRVITTGRGPGGAPVATVLARDAGQVGIGTATPGAKLEVYDPSGARLRLRTAAGQADLYNDGALNVIAPAGGLSLQAGVTRFGAGGTYHSQVGAQTYFNGGNVGIGTPSASARLHVQGDLLVSNGPFILQDGSQGADRVLTSDADGRARWRAAAAAGKDDASCFWQATGFCNNCGDQPASCPSGYFMNGIGGTTTTTVITRIQCCRLR